MPLAVQTHAGASTNALTYKLRSTGPQTPSAAGRRSIPGEPRAERRPDAGTHGDCIAIKARRAMDHVGFSDYSS